MGSCNTNEKNGGCEISEERVKVKKKDQKEIGEDCD